MKRIHPNLSMAAALVALALSFAPGCRNPSSAGVAGNPFFAPGRVPPPATRALAPGQAQPYYPGDPLPAMQSGTAPAAEPQMPSADTNLAWASPGNRAAAPSAAPISNSTAPEPQAVVASGEPIVAVPADQNSLRFELPHAPEPEPFLPMAPTPIAATKQPIQLATPPITQGVMPASFNAPVENSANVVSNTPWQSPQIATGPSVITNPAPYLPASQAPVVVASNNMDVRLRAVASPPIDSANPAIPRIRIPGYAPPMPATGVPTIGSNDGFRPRSSMR